MSPERYVTWLTPYLYQFVHILHEKMEKCLNIIFLHHHSSEHNGLKKCFLWFCMFLPEAGYLEPGFI
jgi:hypothetical protein